MLLILFRWFCSIKFFSFVRPNHLFVNASKLRFLPSNCCIYLILYMLCYIHLWLLVLLLLLLLLPHRTHKTAIFKPNKYRFYDIRAQFSCVLWLWKGISCEIWHIWANGQIEFIKFLTKQLLDINHHYLFSIISHFWVIFDEESIRSLISPNLIHFDIRNELVFGAFFQLPIICFGEYLRIALRLCMSHIQASAIGIHEQSWCDAFSSMRSWSKSY